MTLQLARGLAVTLVTIPLLLYPASELADGAKLDSPDSCVLIADPASTSELDLVFGRRDDVREAEALLEQVKGVGYVDAELALDGCGRWRVFYDGITSDVQGESSRAEARGAGLEAELEVEPVP